jgi:hypothetical protein
VFAAIELRSLIAGEGTEFMNYSRSDPFARPTSEKNILGPLSRFADTRQFIPAIALWCMAALELKPAVQMKQLRSCLNSFLFWNSLKHFALEAQLSGLAHV